MKWTDKKIKEYLNDGNKVILSSTRKTGGVSWVSWVSRKGFEEVILDPVIYDELTLYDKRRVKDYLSGVGCFTYFYSKRLEAYRVKMHDLDNQNADRNP